MTPDEINLLNSSALKRLNAMLKTHKMKPINPDILKSVLQATGGYGKKKWWAPWKKEGNGPAPTAKDKDGKDQLVVKVALCKSIEYASIPCEPDDTFNLRRIPIVVYECIKYIKANGLNSSGIFRVNGSEKRMAQLATVFDTGPRYGHGFNFEGYTIYDVADFLKKYIRGLPEPLLTCDLYPHFLKCLEVPVEDGARVKAYRWLCMLLPPPHLVLLECLLDLFSVVVANAETNQMTSSNLARIFSPNLLRPKAEQKQALEEFQTCSFVVEFIIENYEQFYVSSREARPFDILDASYLPKRKNSFAKALTPKTKSVAELKASPLAEGTPAVTGTSPPVVVPIVEGSGLRASS
ncbi:hypothetical protein HK101_002207 [Irineochytrium annulatum]|nr:hypothetical protein HK101_002207 [Irineochytrium annulatum]